MSKRIPGYWTGEEADAIWRETVQKAADAGSHSGLPHPTAKAHYEKYAKMAEDCHVTLKGSGFTFDGYDVRGAYAANRHLSSIPLRVFDGYYIWMSRLPDGPKSLAENCCMYKHLILYEMLGLVPVWPEWKMR